MNITNNNEKKTKVVDSVNNKNGSLILGFSNCGKTYLKNHILFGNQEPIFRITKSLNQYPNIRAQTSDDNQPLNEYKNSFVVFDDMLLSEHESNIDLFFLLEVDIILLIFTIFLIVISIY